MDVRPAESDDIEAVAAFTRDTWRDRELDDYLPRVFERWVDESGDDRQVFVAEESGEVVGVVQSKLLTDWEAWTQGLRVHPEHRGRSIGAALTDAALRWARERGATTARNLIFSWNTASLGLSRSAGFEPCTEFRWALPEPDADATPAFDVEADADPDAAWAFWTGSDAREHLRGLALDADEAWALSEVSRDAFRAAAEEERLLVVLDDGVRAVAVRTGVRSHDGEAPTRAEYAVGAWRPGDDEAARALLAGVARDAGERGASEARVLIPESVAWVSDAASGRADVADEPHFVFAADLTAAADDVDGGG